MIKLNSFNLNGKASSTFPFYVAVEVNDPPGMAEKKDKLWEPETATGIRKQKINAWGSKQKSYKFYLHNVTKEQYREFKKWLLPEGWFTEGFETDLKYYYESLQMNPEVCDEVNGWSIEVTFTCQPFGMLPEKVLTNPTSVSNDTNAPMYPKLVIAVNSGSETWVMIGPQTVTFKPMNDTVTLECKPGEQNCTGTGGKPLNGMMKGEFFEVMPGTHAVTKSAGISSITITVREGWN